MSTSGRRKKRQATFPQRFGNFEYNFYLSSDDGKGTWLEAQAGCSANGMNLASITSQEIQDFVISQVLSGTALPEPVYIGGHDQNSEGSYEWISGEPWSYSNPLRTTSNDAIYECIGYVDTGKTIFQNIFEKF